MNRRKFFFTSAALSSAVVSQHVSAATTEEPNAADIGYCQDMTIHHLQALSMCRRVLGRSTGDDVQAAAAEVLENQSMEVGQMRAWLTDWGASTVPPTTVMGWMGGDAMPLSMMPGYATNDQLLELSTLSGIAQGRKWLELMRTHHLGGVMMAEHAQQHASSGKVIRLAALQVMVQNFEISQYDLLLSGQYASV